MDTNSLEILKKYWGYDSFREPQQEIIFSVLQKKDTLAILPTGGGKSICFQIPALLQEGICLVISPLIALMQDQVSNLQDKGISAVALTGTIVFHELERILNNAIYGAYQFLYISPERLQNAFVQEKLKSMKINLIAIDEAHCISHWGQDFRPAYLACGQLREWFPEVPIIALTASATPAIEQDIIKNLQLQYPNIIKKTLRRVNLSYMVYEIEDKRGRLERILSKNTESSIIYVRNRKLTMELTQYLKDKGFSATFFHGGLSSEEKKIRMNMWLMNDVQVMVATNAFGMGIDKPDVRTVIHWDLPNSLEDYFQEAGRAGRDGKKAYAFLLYNQNDVKKLQYTTQLSQVSLDYLKLVYRKLCNYFQIAYAEGEGTTHVFKLSDFTFRNKLDVYQTYQALEVLDRNSVLSLSQAFYRKATLRILVSSEQVRSYLLQNPAEKELMYYLMRNYTGIYEQIISFQVEKIAPHIRKSTNEILQQLNRLKANQIIEYKEENTDAEITFLMPRDDDRTIHFISPQVKWFNKHKKEQAQAVFDFLNAKNQCKERFLLAYFGEKTDKDCEICSYCIEKKSKNNLITPEIELQIMQFLQEKPTTSQEICQKFSIEESKIILLLKKWIDKQIIKRNSFNQYTT
ncbi:RecQ family ATP-dependent DNA helicase [Capnocytophaga catalasegens]|uniref:ATP-dependent DNA helicase RecQ n=1 Tax=Capnocytophaga catalasegens TaxID=1004260 RepID=A0AAV5ATW8_9FLAO|nr:ATP-dependent DNA helicase RecQ [Capnocytophaga catalasegens]GIZ15210.1 ATP-dependent DNA helicase RecQ2 [Capnocytophaga catalasegens]GJM49725.1 ATP-dependent DNA helicase RecQ2 [Capnocytophaga catalasegens]GJM52790.1 ATP-dependent DNA helicase RecQ2 [Capnocytophaga catalasegens]